MATRFGYDGNEGIYYDTEKPTGDVDDERGPLYHEAEESDVIEHLNQVEKENTDLRAQLEAERGLLGEVHGFLAYLGLWNGKARLLTKRIDKALAAAAEAAPEGD